MLGLISRVQDTWLAIERLRAEVECQAAQAILSYLFADSRVTQALGMGVQLRELRRGQGGNELPEGLFAKLKGSLGSHIKDK